MPPAGLRASRGPALVSELLVLPWIPRSRCARCTASVSVDLIGVFQPELADVRSTISMNFYENYEFLGKTTKITKLFYEIPSGVTEASQIRAAHPPPGASSMPRNLERDDIFALKVMPICKSSRPLGSCMRQLIIPCVFRVDTTRSCSQIDSRSGSVDDENDATMAT